MFYYIVFELYSSVHIFATRYLIEIGFGSKCCILNGQVIYIEKSKLNIADMWLIPPDRVTYTLALNVLCIQALKVWIRLSV